MESNINRKKENKTIDSILLALVILLIVKLSIDLFFFDLLPPLADNIFWVGVSVAGVIAFYLKKSYIYLAVMLVILIAGLFNF
ncbi:hypothetical protein [Gracilibacillus salinarum]|uniref:Uncharacterized protein n=1 Tax=Gracilibacillus salinarum TaxID=2932255 RepID=A0ABY4GKH9_9BACI|nr:hypothetical protein [Gracilibacillus salinarum]UOQ84681.1 hypothetical protein MUN87_18785 [Gracilibacillus salinarum]